MLEGVFLISRHLELHSPILRGRVFGIFRTSEVYVSAMFNLQAREMCAISSA
jgi:hypothetical protein